MAIQLITTFQGKAPVRGELRSSAGVQLSRVRLPRATQPSVRTLGVETRPESSPTLPSRDLQSDGTVSAWMRVNWAGQRHEHGLGEREEGYR